MKKYWETKDGREIEYKKLSDSHLLNILKFIEKRAEEGIERVIDYGYCGDDDFPTGEVDYLYGEEALMAMDYYGLKKEAKRRKQLTPNSNEE